jgi:hypothetical protein
VGLCPDLNFFSHPAVGDIDFTALDVAITFNAANTRMCFNISIENDNIYEDQEKFFVSLASDSTLVIIDPQRQTAEATINDTDGE